MSKELTVESAAEIIASAFAPLRCVAEPWDYSYRVRFRVFDGADEPLLSAEELLRPQVTDPRRLESIIAQARNNLSDRGHQLLPWEFPSDAAPAV